MTPAVSQVSTADVGGVSGTRQRKQGFPSPVNNCTWPVAPTHPPCTQGVFVAKDHSFSKKRIAKLSVASITRSTPSSNRRILSAVTSATSGWMLRDELICDSRSAAAAALAFPCLASCSSYSDCRCKFDQSTTSRSTQSYRSSACTSENLCGNSSQCTTTKNGDRRVFD